MQLVRGERRPASPDLPLPVDVVVSRVAAAATAAGVLPAFRAALLVLGTAVGVAVPFSDSDPVRRSQFPLELSGFGHFLVRWSRWVSEGGVLLWVFVVVVVVVIVVVVVVVSVQGVNRSVV